MNRSVGVDFVSAPTDQPVRQAPEKCPDRKAYLKAVSITGVRPVTPAQTSLTKAVYEVIPMVRIAERPPSERVDSDIGMKGQQALGGTTSLGRLTRVRRRRRQNEQCRNYVGHLLVGPLRPIGRGLVLSQNELSNSDYSHDPMVREPPFVCIDRLQTKINTVFDSIVKNSHLAQLIH